MRVVLLAKPRYRDRPGVVHFVEHGVSAGHRVEIWDHKQLLAADPQGSDVDVVLAKSHYWKPAVAGWLAESCARVVNSPRANERCRTRRGIDQHLVAAGVPTPPSLEPGQVLPATGRYIVKPDAASDHGLAVVDPAAGAEPTDGEMFYQELVAAVSTVKVYVIGSLRVAYRLTYPSADSIVVASVVPEREDLGPPEGKLDEIVTAVGDGLGLEVFNVDLVCSGEDEWFVVDVNPFPSFEAIAGAPLALWQLIERGRRPDLEPRGERSGHAGTAC